MAAPQTGTSTAAPSRHCPELPGQVVLVLQGGGALGAYQLGVYEAIHEAGIEPDWVIGTSIGAINGAIIAGNTRDRRMDRLREFWESVEHKGVGEASLLWPGFGNASANMMTFMTGIPGFFTPNPAAAFGPHIPLGVERAAYYSTTALKQTLGGLVDLEHLNGGKPRLTVGAVKVRTGEFRYFDSRKETLGLHHVMGSSALPPAFPAVSIDGVAYWDGGIYSNTPIEAVFDDNPRQDSIVFAVHIWDPIGAEPDTIWQVLGRHKDIQYASHAKSHIDRQQQIHRLRRIVRELARRLPESQRDVPEVQRLAAYGCGTTTHVVRLVAPRLEGEDQFRDIDFTPEGIRARRQAGYAHARQMLERAPWKTDVDPISGVAVHNLD